MLDVIWLPAALDDIELIAEYISGDNVSAALEVVDKIEGKVAKLSEFPKMGRAGQVPATRELVALSNYIVVYEDTPDAIRVLRVLHAAQRWPVKSTNKRG